METLKGLLEKIESVQVKEGKPYCVKPAESQMTR